MESYPFRKRESGKPVGVRIACSPPVIRPWALRDLGWTLMVDRQAFHPEIAWDKLKIIQMCAGKALVAEVGGEFAGYVAVSLKDDAGRIESIAVSEAHRGRGVGRALLMAALEKLGRAGASEVTLEVAVAWEAARTLYGSEGFEVAEHLPKWYDDGSDAVRMVRKFKPGEVA